MVARDIIRVWLCAIALASCAWVARAKAEPELELDLARPDDATCPLRAWLLARVQARLGRALGEVNEGWQVAVQIAQDEHGYQLSLETKRGSERGKRTFRAASCGELSEAAALVIALSLDPAAAPPAPPPAARAEPPARPSRGQLSLRASALLESGFVPRIGPGAELALAASFGRSHPELSGFWLSPAQSAREAGGERVEVTLWAARASYCHDLVGSKLRLGACGGLELGRASGRGRGLAPNRRTHFAWSAGGLALRLSARLHRRLQLVLEPALALPFARGRFVSRDAQGRRLATLHTTSSLSKRVSLGLRLLF